MISHGRFIVCEETDFLPIFAGLLKCKHCSHVVANMNLSDEGLRSIYKKSYFFGDEYVDYIADSKVLRKNFQLRLKSLAPYLDKEKHKILFEVGCAYGFF
jgi:hypothetical protein